MPNLLQVLNAQSSLLALGMPGGWEWIVLLVLGLLIFGRRLPEVGRSLGRGIVEFKKGIKGFEDEIESESSKPASSQRSGQLPNQTNVSVQGAREQPVGVDSRAGDE